MKITPIEIERHQFQRVFRGCDPVEVKAFLSQVARQIEDLVRENQALKETHARLNDELSELRGHEAQLRNALASAGRVTDEMKEAAEGGTTHYSRGDFRSGENCRQCAFGPKSLDGGEPGASSPTESIIE